MYQIKHRYDPHRPDMGPTHAPTLAEQLEQRLDPTSLVEPQVLRVVHDWLLEHQLAAGGCRVCRAIRGRDRCALHQRTAPAVVERPRQLPSPVHGWLTTATVAQLLGITPSTVRRSYTARLDGMRTPSGRWLFHPDSVRLLIRAQAAKELSR